MNDKQFMFSLLTGDVYSIEKDELKNMDKYQIPLTKKPPVTCNRCFGRLHEGKNTKLGVYLMCRKCIPKCVDFKNIKSENIEIETFKHD